MNTDTPQTDAMINDWTLEPVPAEFARRLEREKNQFKAERDEARGKVTRLVESKERILSRAEAIRCELVSAIKERGEARAELERIADFLDAHFERGGTVAGLATTNRARKVLGGTIASTTTTNETE